MKSIRHMGVLLVLIGMSVFITSNAVASGFGSCKLTGTWLGCKAVPDQAVTELELNGNCEGNLRTDLVVTIVAHDFFKRNLSIFAQHDSRFVQENYQGDAKQSGYKPQWDYTLYAVPNGHEANDLCSVTNGKFHFNRKKCKIWFEELVSRGTGFPECNNTDSTPFKGHLNKLEVND